MLDEINSETTLDEKELSFIEALGPSPKTAAEPEKVVADVESKAKRRSRRERRRPGGLKSRAYITLQTGEAANLFMGRKPIARSGTDKVTADIPGCNMFAAQAKTCLTASRRGDPYADQCFVRLDALIQAVQSDYRMLGQKLDTLGADAPFRVEDQHSVRPLSFELNYACTYAFIGAQLVTSADALFVKVLCLGHIGVLNRNKIRKLKWLVSAPTWQVWGAFQSFVPSNTVRKHYVPHVLAPGERAIQNLGPIDQRVLTNKVRPSYGLWAVGRTEEDDEMTEEALAELAVETGLSSFDPVHAPENHASPGDLHDRVSTD